MLGYLTNRAVLICAFAGIVATLRTAFMGFFKMRISARLLIAFAITTLAFTSTSFTSRAADLGPGIKSGRHARMTSAYSNWRDRCAYAGYYCLYAWNGYVYHYPFHDYAHDYYPRRQRLKY